MSWLTRLLGANTEIKFEGETTDGRTFKGKTKLEVIGYTPEEVLNHLARKIEFEKNVQVKKIKITDQLDGL